MFGAPVHSGLTFTKVLGGLSKTLSVANQVIPLYREAKPMIQNAKTIFSVLKDIGKSNSSSEHSSVNEAKNTNIQKDSFIESPSYSMTNNSPRFFL